MEHIFFLDSRNAYRNGSEERSAPLVFLADELIEELHELLLSLAESEVGKSLKCFGHQCEIPDGTVVWVCCRRDHDRLDETRKTALDSYETTHYLNLVLY